MWDNGTGTDTWDKLCKMGHMAVPRTVPPVPCGTVGQWDGTDTLCTMGHMGVHRTVPPVPCGTMGRDGHLGQAMYDGTHGSL